MTGVPFRISFGVAQAHSAINTANDKKVNRVNGGPPYLCIEP